MNQLYGMQRPTSGTIRVYGKEVQIHSPREAIALGIGMVHQHFMLAPSLSVLQNIILGNQPKKGPFIDRKTARRQVQEILDRYAFQLDLDARVYQLSVGQMQRVEIVKALYRGAKILILDEPTAVLTPQEVEELIKIMRRLREQGCSLIIITHKLKDKNRYQTVYAKNEGSAAAPTAGLHFTPELLEKVKEMGVNIAHVTLHVGLGTFRPVKVDDVEKHHMHSEFYIVEEDQAKLINDTKKNGGRVISVGTTSCRTLESATGEDGIVKAGSGWTEIFIYPGYKFKAIDGLITNFHLPESTLLMLVSALAGKEHIMAAYEEAVKERYRFFSFGDAMMIE